MRTLSRALALTILLSTDSIAQSSGADLQKLFQQGEAALAQGRYAEAESVYEKLRLAAPNVAEVYGRLGLVYFEERRFSEAVPVLHRALKLKPGLPNTDVLLAMSLSELGRYKEALAGLQRGFEQSTDKEIKRTCGLELERAYTGLRQDAKAVEVALGLSNAFPDDPEILYHAGRLYGNLAFLTMQRLAQVAPSSSWRRQAAGEVYESQGSFDLAVTEYRAVLAQSPNRPGVHFRLGRVLLAKAAQGDAPPDTAAQASSEFEAELRLDPTNASASYELGELQRKAGQPEKARGLFESALKYYPEFAEAHLALGGLLLAQDKPALALPHLQRAIALDPENDVAYFRLSRVYQTLGDAAAQQNALAEFKRLRAHASERTAAADSVLRDREVTKQALDSDAPK